MTKKQMQTVVDVVSVQGDFLYELLQDRNVSAEDKEIYREELRDLCSFVQKAGELGLSIDDSSYSLKEKVAMLNKEVKND